MLLNTLNKDTNMEEEEDEFSGAETIIHDLSSKPLQNRREIVKESYDPIPYNSKAITKLPHTEIPEACPNITVRELAECYPEFIGDADYYQMEHIEVSRV